MTFVIYFNFILERHFIITALADYSLLVYTKTVYGVEGALWLASQTPNILCYLPPSNSGKKRRPGLHPWHAKKSSKLIFCGVYKLAVLVYTKTTIHLSVGG